MNIFFDLDGTLLNARLRLYNLFQHLVPDSGLSLDEYWEYKRNKVDHKTILRDRFGYSKDRISEFEIQWLDKIELPEWLTMDRPYPGISEFLLDLKEKHSLFLVTARQFEDPVHEQIAQNNWSGLFSGVYVTCGKKDKYALINENVKTTWRDWMVGDTGKDIQAGKLLGMRTAAVCSGFLSAESLSPYEPDVLVENVVDLKF